MTETLSDIIEMPMNVPERKDDEGVIAAGPDGKITPESMAVRAKRTDGFIRRVDYRECISCDRCGNSLEIRGFNKRGEERVIALYCPSGEVEVSPYHTCNLARRPRHTGYKKVIYELSNAPKGFEIGMGSKTLKPTVPGEARKLEPTMPEKGYIGGSKFYKRADGATELEGSGQIPKRLMN